MEQWKAKPVDVRNAKILHGDVLIIPFNNTNLFRFPGPILGFPEQVNYVQPWLTTMNAKAGAGFYSSIYGPLPWALAYVPPERYDVLRVR